MSQILRSFLDDTLQTWPPNYPFPKFSVMVKRWRKELEAYQENQMQRYQSFKWRNGGETIYSEYLEGWLISKHKAEQVFFGALENALNDDVVDLIWQYCEYSNQPFVEPDELSNRYLLLKHK